MNSTLRYIYNSFPLNFIEVDIVAYTYISLILTVILFWLYISKLNLLRSHYLFCFRLLFQGAKF